MNEQQYQQGRDTLISTLNWTSESIDEFARKVLYHSIREDGKDSLISMLNDYKSDVIKEIDGHIKEIEGVK